MGQKAQARFLPLCTPEAQKKIPSRILGTEFFSKESFMTSYLLSLLNTVVVVAPYLHYINILFKGPTTWACLVTTSKPIKVPRRAACTLSTRRTLPKDLGGFTVIWRLKGADGWCSRQDEILN